MGTRDRLASCGVYTHEGKLAFTAIDEVEDWQTIERFWSCRTLPCTAQEIGTVILGALDSGYLRATADESEQMLEFAPVLECLGVEKVEVTYPRRGHLTFDRLYGSRDITVSRVVRFGSGWSYEASADLQEPGPAEVGDEAIRLLRLDT